MNKLSCKMCGSPNILQYGNIYICQNCGTRYSVNDIQKMMIMGKVDVSGSTVNINNSERLNNLYLIARRARDNNNWTDAERNYNMILIDDPYSWEASFYVVYSRAMQCKIMDITSAANSIRDVEASVLSLIRTNVDPAYYFNPVNEIAVRSIEAANMLALGAHGHFEGIGSSIQNQYYSEYISRRNAALGILLTCGDQIEYIFGNITGFIHIAVTVWKAGVDLISRLPIFGDQMEPQFLERIERYDRKYILEIQKKRLEEKIENTKCEIRNNKFPVIAIVILIILVLCIAIMSIITHVYEVLCIILPVLLIVMGLIIQSINNDDLRKELKKLQTELNVLQNELSEFL